MSIIRRHIAAFILLLFLGVFFSASPASAAPRPLEGYAWSSAVGWVSFSGTTVSGVPYGVSVDETTGDLSGYAWSPNVGWLSLNRADTGAPPDEAPGGAGAALIPDLIGRWAFDDPQGSIIAADSSGNNNFGTLINSPAWDVGREGGALRFNGINSYVTVGDPASGILDFGANQSFTLSAWVKLGGSDDPDIVISKGPAACAACGSGYELITRPNEVSFIVDTDGSGPLTFPVSYATASHLDDDWHHVSGVRDGSELRLYLDGALVASASDPAISASAENSYDFSIGNRSGSLFSVNGVIDDVRIYSRALIETEIQTLSGQGGGALATLNPATRELEGWARFLSWGAKWDGWVSFSGGSYRVFLDGLELKGYAWGSDVVGWLSMGGKAADGSSYGVKVASLAPSIAVTLAADPASGRRPLTNVDLIADVSGSGGGNLVYQFDCEKDGVPDGAAVETGATSYTAADLCNYPAVRNYTAAVTVEEKTSGFLPAGRASAEVPITVYTTVKLSGYAWSSNIGWISLLGTAADGSDYSVFMDDVTGELSGYAWSGGSFSTSTATTVGDIASRDPVTSELSTAPDGRVDGRDLSAFQLGVNGDPVWQYLADFDKDGTVEGQTTDYQTARFSPVGVSPRRLTFDASGNAVVLDLARDVFTVTSGGSITGFSLPALFDNFTDIVFANNSFWISGRSSFSSYAIVRLDLSGNLVKTFPMPRPVLRMVFDGVGTIWTINSPSSGNYAVSKLSVSGGGLIHFRVPSTVTPTDIAVDSSGAAWIVVATNPGVSPQRVGYARIPPSTAANTLLTINYTLNIPYSTSPALAYDDTDMWVSLPASQTFARITPAGAVSNLSFGVSGGLMTSDGTYLWVAQSPRGLSRVRISDGSLRSYPGVSGGDFDGISDLDVNGGGDVWTVNYSSASVNRIYLATLSGDDLKILEGYWGVSSPLAVLNETGGIGWIDFGPAGPYPDDPQTPARYNFATSRLEGWVRAVGYGTGWDGWIKLSGTALDGSPYGVTRVENRFEGFAWGGDLIGWLSFCGPNSTPHCVIVSGLVQPVSATLAANPPSGKAPLTVSLTATVATTNDPVNFPVTYKFDCTSDGVYEGDPVITASLSYTAPDICTYNAAGLYTAKVYVEQGVGMTANDTATVKIQVSPKGIIEVPP